jgi:hypothetical protein
VTYNPANDTEKEERIQDYSERLGEAGLEANKHFPKYAEILAKHNAEMERLRREIPPEELAKYGFFEGPLALETARFTIEWTNYVNSEEGTAREAMISELVGLDTSEVHRAGVILTEHCHGLLRTANLQ